MLEPNIKLTLRLFKTVENWRFLFAKASTLILSSKYLVVLEYTNYFSYSYLAIPAKNCHSLISYYNVVAMVRLNDEISDAVLSAVKEI